MHQIRLVPESFSGSPRAPSSRRPTSPNADLRRLFPGQLQDDPRRHERFAEMALGTPSWLNLDFTEGILRRSEGDNSIQVIDIFTKPATNKGDNYTSDMVRVFVEFSRKQGDRRITEKRSIIVKIAPTIEGMRKELIMQSRIFDTEMSMMTNTLKKMNDMLGSGHRLNGQALYVQKENPTLLVIEDLAPLGYRMADRQAGLDLAHCLLAIRGLAVFHASTVAVCEKEPKQKGLYRKGMFSEENPPDLGGFFSAGTKALAAEVATWPELGPRYAEKVERFADHIYSKGIESCKLHEEEFNVINHGDFWVNNMLFRYNDEGKPIDHIFVDFQMCVYTSPAMDLLYFLSTSPTEEVLEKNKDTLLEEYLRTLSSTMKRLGCETAAPTKDELMGYVKKRACYGMIAAFSVLPLVRMDKSEVKDLDEIMKQDGTYDNPAYKGEIYRKTMINRIPLYEKMGLLD
ncbi:hypothetical protein KM043_000354 [Ampulex compressa]|nr:hypothetical protein KM043_000354 [Ampulex compressa]